MSNHNNHNDASKEHKGIKSQQFNMDDLRRQQRRRTDEDEDEGRMMPPGMAPGAPGMGQAPRTAPPSFIPEMPGMERRPMGRPGMPGMPGRPGMPGPIVVPIPGREEEREEFGFGERERFGVRPRELRRCLNQFTFIWLINGNSFWFFPTFVGRNFVQGFRWRRNRWEFDTINLRRILFFRCF